MYDIFIFTYICTYIIDIYRPVDRAAWDCDSTKRTSM